MSLSRQQRGMTVIELLVVIAIIAVVAMVLLPMLATTHRPTRIARCLMQLRQIAAAGSVYASDNNNRFPNLDKQPGNDGPVALLLLTPYLRDPTNIFICP